MRRVEDPGLRRRIYTLAIILLVLVALTMAWQWSPLKSWLTPDRMVATLRELGDAIGPWGALLALTLALCLAMPLGLLTLVSQLALGPWLGSACLILSALISAMVSQTIGRHLGHTVLLKLAGPKLMRLSESLERRGLAAVIALRLVPAAPFAIANMVAGSTHLRRRDMLLGSAIGMLPGTVLIALFTDQILAALAQPGPGRYVLIAVIVGLLVIGTWALKKWLGRPQP